MKGVKQRTTALMIVAYAGVVYTLAEVVHAVRGRPWRRLERHLDGVDERLDAAESACLKAGARGFVERIGRITGWIEAAVDGVTGRMRRLRPGPLGKAALHVLTAPASILLLLGGVLLVLVSRQWLLAAAISAMPAAAIVLHVLGERAAARGVDPYQDCPLCERNRRNLARKEGPA